jgi:hypothetical protein
MPKRERPRAAATNSTRPDDDFAQSSVAPAKNTLRDLLPTCRGSLADIDAAFAEYASCCTICGGEAVLTRRHWLSDEERAGWNLTADFLAYSLCAQCVDAGELTAQRLVARFGYFLDGPKGGVQ